MALHYKGHCPAVQWEKGENLNRNLQKSFNFLPNFKFAMHARTLSLSIYIPIPGLRLGVRISGLNSKICAAHNCVRIILLLICVFLHKNSVAFFHGIVVVLSFFGQREKFLWCPWMSFGEFSNGHFLFCLCVCVCVCSAHKSDFNEAQRFAVGWFFLISFFYAFWKFYWKN